MKEFWNSIRFVFTVIGGWLGYFLGGYDGLLYALVVFMVADYITGVMCAVSDKKLSSAVGFKGICRKLPMTEDVFRCFQAIIEDRERPKIEKVVDGHSGFLFLDKNGMPLIAMHWKHRFNNMVKRYNEIYRVQMPNITPHVCRHTYCSNMAKAGMNPKTLQYLMGHSDIGVTLNTYTHLGLDDATDELKRLQELETARKELEKTQGEKQVSQKMFKVI